MGPSRDVAQLGRAPALGAGCRRFESCRPDWVISKRTLGGDLMLLSAGIPINPYGKVSEWLKEEVCKTFGSAYTGSNPVFPTSPS